MCELDLAGLAEQVGIETDNILEDGCGPANTPPAEAHPIIRQFAIGFLNLILRDGEPSAAFISAEAASEYPRVAYEQLD